VGVNRLGRDSVARHCPPMPRLPAVPSDRTAMRNPAPSGSQRRPAAPWVRALLLALLALPAVSDPLPGRGALARAADEPARFARERPVVQHELAAVLPFDLSADGRQELVVLEVERSPSRDVAYTLRVLHQDEAGFVPLPGATVALPRDVTLAGVGTFRGGPGLALLLPGELAVWPWREGRFAPEAAARLAVDSLFPVPGGELKQGLTWLADLDGDGVDELLVPRFDGVAVIAQGADGQLRQRALLRIRPAALLLDWFRRNLLAYEVPTLAVQPADGHGWQDVVLFMDSQLWVFLLDDALDGGERAPAFVLDLQPPKPFDPKLPRDPPMRLVSAQDLNGDGHFDLIVSKNAPSDSQFNSRTHVLVYYGRAGTGGAPIGFPAEPDQVHFTEGFSVPLVLDVNGDGRKDLVLVNVEIGFWNVIKALISRSVNAQAAFYLMPPEGRLPRDPQRLQTYEVTFSLGRFSHQPIADFGDLNGDGLPDLLLSENKETVGIHWGQPGGVWASAPDARLKDDIPLAGARVRVGDLDGDGRDDLLFVYNRDDIRQMPEANHTFTVLRSRYGAPRTVRPAGTAATGRTPAAPPARP